MCNNSGIRDFEQINDKVVRVRLSITSKSLVFLLTLVTATIGRAEQISLSPAEQQWLADHPVIQLAPDPDFAPIEYLDKDGEFKGISADYAKLVGERLGIEFTVARLPTWDDVLAAAKTQKVDMFGAANSTPQREEYMSFTQPHIFLPGVIITRDDTDGQLTLGDIAGKRVAAVSGYAWFDMIGNDFPNFKMEGVPTLTDGLRSLSFGELDAIISDPATATEVIRNEGLTNLRIAGNTGYNFTLAFGVRKDWPELTSMLNRAIDTISEEERDEILQKWVSLEQEIVSDQLLYAIIAIVAAIAVIAAGTIGWNRILSNRVDERTRELNAARQELVVINEELEKRVEERTRKLRRTLRQLQASQSQLVQSEKMATMGQLVAGVAHEINTPLGYVYNNVQLLTDFVSRVDQQTQEFDTLSELMTSDDANDNQISAQFQRVQKSSKLLTDDDGLRETRELIDDSAHGLRQISELVLSLKDFSRIDRAIEEGVDLHENIEHTLKICQHVTRNCAEIIKRYGNIPEVRCNPSQINQVLLNIITNSCHAIQDSGQFGKILISTDADSEYVYVSIQDDGVGMPEDVGRRIFEPFYTTKKAGSGTGLGLSISHNILEAHHAKLHLHSRVGKGTLFKFGLPRNPPQKKPEPIGAESESNVIDMAVGKS